MSTTSSPARSSTTPSNRGWQRSKSNTWLESGKARHAQVVGLRPEKTTAPTIAGRSISSPPSFSIRQHGSASRWSWLIQPTPLKTVLPASSAMRQTTASMCARSVAGKVIEIWWGRSTLAEGLALMVIVKVPREPEPLDPWKATWDGLIWKAMIPKVKAIEGELNRNPRPFQAGRSQQRTAKRTIMIYRRIAELPWSGQILDGLDRKSSCRERV